MPKKKQRLTEQPDEKVIKKLFPKKVVDKQRNRYHIDMGLKDGLC